MVNLHTIELCFGKRRKRGYFFVIHNKIVIDLHVTMWMILVYVRQSQLIQKLAGNYSNKQ